MGNNIVNDSGAGNYMQVEAPALCGLKTFFRLVTHWSEYELYFMFSNAVTGPRNIQGEPDMLFFFWVKLKILSA